MKNLNYFVSYLSLTLLMILILNACGTKEIKKHDAKLISNYIISHNNEQVSVSDQIFIRFNALPYDAKKINQKLDNDIAKISPNVEGDFYWKDNQTLYFKNQGDLDFDTKYIVSINLKALIEKSKINSYNFEFNTDKQYFKLSKSEFISNSKMGSDSLNLEVSIRTNARLTDENLKEYINLKDEKGDVKKHYSFNKKSEVYTIKYSPIVKSAASKKIELIWNFPKSNVKGKHTILVPSKSDFDLLSVSVTNAKSGHIKAVFSNSLGAQKYEGLVRINNYKGKYKFTAKGNQLDIYVDNEIVGRHTIVFNKNIIDVNKYLLKEEESFDLKFKAKMPQVRTANDGIIVPYKDKVIFPFEAVALDTIEIEVFKLFENNMLDFLRYDNLKNTSINHYFGRVIHNQKIALRDVHDEDNSHDWTHYSLDLQKLTSIDPGAIYQVRIGFKKSFSNYECDQASNTISGRGVDVSCFKNFRYYEGYDYNHQSNPCYPAYYSRNKFVYQNLLASNLGLIVKRGKQNNIKAIATDLNSGRPLSNTTIKLYDAQQQLLMENITDGQGMVDFKSERAARFIVAQNGNSYAYISLENRRSNSMSSFDVSGASPQGDINGYIFGERGVWRPGDTLHLSYMLYDRKNTMSSDHPVKLTVKDSKGKTKYNFSESQNQNGYYVFHVPTQTSDPTGQWTATAKIGNMTTSRNLKIETIKPNRIKVDLNFENDELDVSGKDPFVLNAKWLHGAPASSLKSQVDIKYSNVSAQFDDYQQFEFNDPARKISSNLANIFNGNVDENGQKEISIKFGSDFLPPGKLNAKIRTRVFEKSGNYSEDFTSININPYKSYVGVKVPKGRWGDHTLNVDKKETIEIVALDKNGKALKNKQLSIGVYNAEWRWWYRRNNSNIFQYNSSKHFSAEEKATLKTDNNGLISFVPDLNGYGSYLIRVCDDESGHCTGQLFYSNYYSRNNQEDGQVAKLNFTTDKNIYAPGEKVVLTVPTSKNSKLLVSLENNQEVLDAFWVESTGETTTVPFKVRPEMLPNVYVNVSLIQNSNKDNDLPMRLYGVTSIKVEDPNTKLQPVIKCEDEFEPNSIVDISVEEELGKEMSYSLAIIDEGLLDITNFRTPNPFGHFFSKQALGVKSWDIYDLVLNKYGNDIAKIFSVGGDGSGEGNSESPSANRFKSVVKFLGPFTVSKGNKNNHKVEIPNYIGAVRIMVVGKNRVAFGKTEKNVPVKKPLMVLSTLPRVLAPGEELSVPVNVFAYQDDIESVDVSVSANNFLTSEGVSKSTLKFERQGDQLSYFDFKVGGITGIGTFNFDVSSGSHSAHENIEIDIRNPSPEKSEVYSELIKQGDSWNKSFNSIGISGSNNAVVEISKFPSFNLDYRLKYLIRYPYGCVEQTTSSVFPQLYLNDISELSGKKQDDIKRNIQAGIKRLMGFQTLRGGLSYWQGSGTDNDWGTSYAGHFLLEARDRGFYISDGFFNKWVKYQKTASDQYIESNYAYTQKAQAYRLYTLALSGNANLSAMNRFRVEKQKSKISMFLLAAAYSLVGQNDIAKNLIENLDYSIEDYQEWSYTYGSSMRDRSVILLTLMNMNEEESAYKLALDIGKNLGSNKWYNTQATAFALMSLTKFLGKQSKNELEYSFNFNSAMKVDHSSKEVLDAYDLDLSKKENHSLLFENKSEGNLYVRVINSGKPLPQPSPSYAKGLKMDVIYKNSSGEKIDPSVLDQGTDFIAEVKIKNTSASRQKYKELALNHTLPSGWEIQNLRLGDMQNTNESSNRRRRNQQPFYDFQDIKDDRVYTFFDLNPEQTIKIQINLTATYAGKFFMPNITCEAMYDKEIAASQEGAWVQVRKVK